MATLTVASASAALARRLGPVAALADLPEAFSYSLRFLGQMPVALTSVVDADLAPLEFTSVNAFLDIAEYRALAAMLANLDEVDLVANGITMDLEKLRLNLQRRLETTFQFCRNAYNLSLPTVTGGVWEYDFAAQNDHPPGAIPS